MIRPRWLVQSSAIGVVGAAVVAASAWVTLDTHHQSDDDSVMIQQVSVEQAERLDSSTKIKKVRIHSQRVDSGGQEPTIGHVRVHQVRYQLVDGPKPGPTCPFDTPHRKGEAVDVANSVIDQGVNRAGQSVDTDETDDDVPRGVPTRNAPPWQ